MKSKIYCCFGANGETDPRQRKGSNVLCSDCGKKFSFWDDLNIGAFDEKSKCAKCKGIVLIKKTQKEQIKGIR
jgi:hypothetical protein